MMDGLYFMLMIFGCLVVITAFWRFLRWFDATIPSDPDENWP